MLQRIWQWLRQRWQRWFDRPSVAQPVESKPSRPVRSDTEYEALFMRLLEGINQGWGRSDVQGFLFSNALSTRSLTEWLHRFSDRLLESSAPNPELADRLTKLGALRVGSLSQGAIELASRLRPEPKTLSESAAPVPAQPTCEDLPTAAEEAEAYQKQGIQKSLAGDHHGALDDFDHVIQLNPKNDAAWYNRGVVLKDLGRLPEAIENFDQSLQLNPNLHQAWNNRGNALADLGQLPEAVESFDQSLQLNPNDDGAWNNRGKALQNLGRLLEAIENFDQSLQLNPNLHQAWSNRGNALADLGQLPEAIESLDHAIQLNPNDNSTWYGRGVALGLLERYPEAIDSFDHAIQLNPNDNSTWSNRGVALGLLERYPEAIDSFNHALTLNPKLYQAWIGRGNSVGSLTYETISPLLAISQQNPALNQPGYFGELANYEEGLKHVKRDSDSEGWGRLHRAIGRTHYFKGEYETNSRFYYRQAVQSYHTALETLTEQALPQAHLELLQDLIRACLGLNDREAANHWRLQGLRVLRELINQQSDFARKQRLEAEFSGFSQIAVDVLVQDGQIVAALEAAERYKNRCLTWILEEWQEQVVSPSYEQMRQLLDAETAIVYYHLSPDSLTTFVLKSDAPEPIVIGAIGVGAIRELPLPESRQQFRAWETWLNDWNRDYQDYRGKKGEKSGSRRNHPWRKNLASRLERLQQILQIEAIESALSGMTQLILIPHRDLHRLPLHVLFSDRFTVTYLPSVQIGLNLQQKQPRGSESWHDCSLLSVEAPVQTDLPLKFAETESEVISRLFQTPTRIAAEQATQTNLDAALRQSHQIFHFTGHGAYNLHQPQHSALGLTGEEQLMAEAIAKTDLRAYELAVLSACETAVTGNQTIETEYVGLVSAFLQAGVTHVVSTLWMVDEISNAWFTIQFYQQLLAGYSPAIALKQTQEWMRHLTCPELALWLSQLSQLDRLDINTKIRLQQFAAIAQSEDPIQDSDTMSISLPPYEPYHWAAFTLTGMVTS